MRVGGKPYTAVDVRLENTGITVYQGELRAAQLINGDGTTQRVAEASAACSHGLDADFRIDVSRSRRGCLLFAADADATRLQLALETVPRRQAASGTSVAEFAEVRRRSFGSLRSYVGVHGPERRVGPVTHAFEERVDDAGLKSTRGWAAITALRCWGRARRVQAEHVVLHAGGQERHLGSLAVRDLRRGVERDRVPDQGDLRLRDAVTFEKGARGVGAVELEALMGRAMPSTSPMSWNMAPT